MDYTNMHDLQNFSDEAFIIVDCAPTIINGALTIVLDRPLSYIYPDQQAYLYIKERLYRPIIVSLDWVHPQLCKITWEDLEEIPRPLGAVIYLGTYGRPAAKASRLQKDLLRGIYEDCITSVLNNFGTDCVDTPLEHE